MTYVYFIQQGSGSIKIGVSDDPDARLRTMQTGTSKPLRVIARFAFAGRAEAFEVERLLHKKYGYLRGRGEWFKPAFLRDLRCRGKRIVGGTKIHQKGGWIDRAEKSPGQVDTAQGSVE